MSNIKNSNKGIYTDGIGFPEPSFDGVATIAGSQKVNRPLGARTPSKNKNKMIQEMQKDVEQINEEVKRIENRCSTLESLKYDVGDLVYLKDGSVGIVSRFHSFYDGTVVVAVATQYGMEEVPCDEVLIKNETTDAIYGK